MSTLLAATPAPTVIHVVNDGGSPVWLTPLLTGVFVLAAALIALASLWLSDRRKLKREDQRQWDRELVDGYVDISVALESLRDVCSAVYNNSRVNEVTEQQAKDLLAIAQHATEMVRARGRRIKLTAPASVCKVIREAEDAALGMFVPFMASRMAAADPNRWEWLRKKSEELDAIPARLEDVVSTALQR